MANLILPRRFRKGGAVKLAPEFFPSSALSFDLRTPNEARNLAQANYGRVLPRAEANWKVGQGGNGIYCTSNTQALLDAAWPNPVVTSSGDGRGDYTVALSISPTAGGKQIALHVRNEGTLRSIFIYANAYYVDGGTGSTLSSGTIWCGDYDASYAKGLRVNNVVNGQRLDIIYCRASTGAAQLWINGVLRASGTVSVSNVNNNVGGTHVSVGGFSTITGVAATYPIHTIHVANNLLDGRISENLQETLYREKKRVLYFDVPSSFPVLSSLTAGYITSSGGRLTAN